MIRRSWVVLLASLAGLALAACLALLAAEVRRSEERLRQADVRLELVTGEGRLESLAAKRGERIARRLLGVRDDVSFRQAVRLFRLTEAERATARSTRESPSAVRVEAGVALERFDAGDTDPVRKSKTANLLGILAFANMLDDPAHGRALIARSLRQFRRAITLNPRNDDAKYNLERLLRLLKSDRAQEVAELLQAQQSSSLSARGGRRGAGVSPGGHGY